MRIPKQKSPLEQQVEENLRRVYRQKVAEPIPDRFIDLLNRLKALETSDDSSDGDENG